MRLVHLFYPSSIDPVAVDLTLRAQADVVVEKGVLITERELFTLPEPAAVPLAHAISPNATTQTAINGPRPARL